MRGERKGYGLQTATRPGNQEHGLSTVVVVHENDQQGYCYIRFTQAFINAVGKALPLGVSDFFPAFVQVEEDEKRWNVYARYRHDKTKFALLWSTTERPEWLRFFPAKVSRDSGHGSKKVSHQA